MISKRKICDKQNKHFLFENDKQNTLIGIMGEIYG
jgi:hypothetical protein